MEELAAYFAVSPITIRRAVKELAERGALMKVYGGVMAATPLPPIPASPGDAGVIGQSRPRWWRKRIPIGKPAGMIEGERARLCGSGPAGMIGKNGGRNPKGASGLWNGTMRVIAAT